MVDIEYQLYTELAKALRDEYKGIFVTVEPVLSPSKFPAVSFAERSNTTYIRTLDSSHSENHSQVMYQVDIYSNKKTGAKAECKAIAGFIDRLMRSYNFVRSFLEPVDNIDLDVYRMTARYTGVISKEKQVYR